MRTIVESLAFHARKQPHRDALITADARLSYGEVWSRANAIAREFARSGVSPGDRVVLAAGKSAAFVCSYFAAHLALAVAVPLDPNAPEARRHELIERVRPKLAFVEGGGNNIGPIAVRSITELLSVPASDAEPTAPALDSLADLLLSSGTTRRPKAIRLSHRNLAAVARHVNSVIGMRETDVEVLPIPLCHSFGLGRLRGNLVAGAAVVLVDGFRLPGEIFAAIDRHRATGLVGVPAGMAVLLQFGSRGLGVFAEQLRYVEIGSAAMPIEHKHALMDLLPNTELWMHYGLTEASRSAFIEFHRHRERLDTVGLPAPGVRFAIRAADGSTCRPGEVGHLWVGGEHVSEGYWDDPEFTATDFVDGWALTGDFGHIEKDGFVTMHGRKDDMIKVGGFKIFPDEIESVLGEHPAVRDAICIGVPDPRRIAGQVVRAYLVAARGNAPDEELSQWVAARLEPYKVPTQYIWAESLPRTSSGKPLRAALRSQAGVAQ